MAAAVVGVLVFAGVIPLGKSQTTSQGTVVMWGTVPAATLAEPLNKFAIANPTFTLKYVQRDAVAFDQDLLEAIASGTGPDMFILPDDLILHYKDRIQPIPFVNYPIANYKANFAAISEVYLGPTGVLALPLSVDPMLMYYNRSLFDGNAVSTVPAVWDDLQGVNSAITKKDDAGKILKSAIGLGQFSNIAHAKDIISMFFMQIGNPIVGNNNDLLYSGLNTNPAALASVLSFYTSFANPLSNIYSWNKSLPLSTDMFSAGNLGVYFGFASELPILSAKNPNLNFNIAAVPQIKNADYKLTFGRTYGVAVSKYSKNPTTALNATGLLAAGDFAKAFSDALNIAPARRDLLAGHPTDAYNPIIYNSALYAKSWLDPSPPDTDTIFKGMVENVLSNNLSAENSVADASTKLELLLNK